MWLLNARTRKLQDFYGSAIPKYAILSHRWEDDEEVTFEAINDHPEQLKGYEKIDRCCKQALSSGARFNDGESSQIEPIEWVWVDTCCIDKRSSAELSEAINSMYKWYANAEICYAFLYDVGEGHSFERSSWFTRGFTLQELLAPKQLFFFDKEWNKIGYRSPCPAEPWYNECRTCNQFCLLDVISEITRIPVKALTNFQPEEYSLGERMSWAAERTTKRKEDLAYCLLGIFGIQMPLLYGEGEDAYRRLQEEIIKVSNDLSLFVWEGSSCQNFGMIAGHPSCFRTEVKRGETPAVDSPFAKRLLSKGYSAGNSGITIKLKLQHYSGHIFIAWLDDPQNLEENVDIPDAARFSRAIFLERDSSGTKYYRVRIHGRCHVLMKWDPLKMGTRKLQIACNAISDRQLIDTCLRFTDLPQTIKLFVRGTSNLPENPNWQRQPLDACETGKSIRCTEVVIKPLSSFGFVCCLSAETQLGSTLDLFIGFDVDFAPICLLQCNDDFFSNPLKRLFHATQSKLLQHARQLLPERSRDRSGWNTRQSLIAMRYPLGDIKTHYIHATCDNEILHRQFLALGPCERGYEVRFSTHSFSSSYEECKFNVQFDDFCAASPHAPVICQRKSQFDLLGFLTWTGPYGSWVRRSVRKQFSRIGANSDVRAIHLRLVIEASVSMIRWKPYLKFVLAVVLWQAHISPMWAVMSPLFLLCAAIVGHYLSIFIFEETFDLEKRIATDLDH